MKQWLGLGVMGLALAGCIPESRVPAGPTPIEGDSITYETGPCFGRCPVYAVTVRPDGTGIFEGKRFTAVTGERGFTLSRAQYDAFAARLAPYRPASGEVRYAHGEPNCANAPTDMPSVEIRWTRAIGDSQGLYFYLGCRRDNAALAEALGGAVELLPVQELIGERP
ncbi:DUF6438 domain-containing protein [Sphingomonas sp. DG1-23]|uniref:DUF6438 domain-containing protein n=1 Tax=Sphingomonas sp. DG1-23 TaxID=3068316 RepID=UPI00273E104F|nr:DUF6438 domain-containing protein [Sphingomonas sp. DG1-23]MDP5277517.1 DUF6438 domain-containing protein [Sphingomonas sp. DG1-23]